MRLWFRGPHDLESPASALAFADERVVLLFGDEVRPFGGDGGVPVPPGARAIAFTMGGGLLVGTIEALFRLGDHPLEHVLPEGFGLRAICVEPGGYWLGGARRVIGFRPGPDGLSVRREFAVQSPVRGLAHGPDGAVYALLENHHLLRDGEHRGDCDAVGIARSRSRLLALGKRSVDDITHFVAPPPEKGPDIVLPACDP